MGNEVYDGFDRLTTILDVYKPKGLIDWMVRAGKKEAKRISTVATKIGTNVDEYIKADIVGAKLPKLKTVEAELCIKAWNRFVEDYGINKLDLVAGSRLFDKVDCVTGEPDILIPRYLEVIDIKCSSEIRPTYWIQTEWYARQLGCEYKSVLRLDKNLGIYEFERRLLCDKDLAVFHNLKEVYRYFKQFEQSSEKEEE